MKTSRKSYRKKSGYRKKRGFRKSKGKKTGSKMMYTRNAYTKQSWTQSFALINANVIASPFCYVAIDLLGGSGPVAGENILSQENVQNAAQAVFDNLYREFTITGVAVKLIFPENFAGNNPISWCMSYNSEGYNTLANVQATPSLIQAE